MLLIPYFAPAKEPAKAAIELDAPPSFTAPINESSNVDVFEKKYNALFKTLKAYSFGLSNLLTFNHMLCIQICYGESLYIPK